MKHRSRFEGEGAMDLRLSFGAERSVTNTAQGNNRNTSSEVKLGSVIRMEPHCIVTRLVVVQQAIVEFDE